MGMGGDGWGWVGMGGQGWCTVPVSSLHPLCQLRRHSAHRASQLKYLATELCKACNHLQLLPEYEAAGPPLPLTATASSSSSSGAHQQQGPASGAASPFGAATGFTGPKGHSGAAPETAAEAGDASKAAGAGDAGAAAVPVGSQPGGAAGVVASQPEGPATERVGAGRAAARTWEALSGKLEVLGRLLHVLHTHGMRVLVLAQAPRVSEMWPSQARLNRWWGAA